MSRAHRVSASKPPLARARAEKHAKCAVVVISVIFVVGGENRPLLAVGVDDDLGFHRARYHHAVRSVVRVVVGTGARLGLREVPFAL